MDREKEKEQNRKLSPAEEKRRERFERYKARMEQEGYACRDLTVGLVYANVMAIVLSVPFIILYTALFIYIGKGTGRPSPLIAILAYVILIPVHEAIHGLGWSLFARGGLRSISFGFIKEYLTPYCTCSEALSKGAYFFGALAPLIILGVIPGVLAAFTGSSTLLIIGIFMTMAAGGDMTIALKLAGFRGGRETVYLDHPYRAGLVVFEKTDGNTKEKESDV